MTVAAVVTLLVAAIAVSAFSVELGLANPSVNTRRIAVAVAEVDSTLEGDATYVEFSEALATGLAAQRQLAVRNAADSRANRSLAQALDRYSALRQAWQAELEGVWDPDTHGDPAYWRAFHPGIGLEAQRPLDPAALREELRLQAREYVEEALALVGR